MQKEHPLDERAMEILRHLWIVEDKLEDPEEQLKVTEDWEKDHLISQEGPPMLTLLEWASKKEEHSQILHQLSQMPYNRVLELLERQDEHLPDEEATLLHAGQMEQERIQERMRWSLNLMLEEAGTELRRRQQKHDRLMELSTLTPEQAELLSDVVDIAIEDEIDRLSPKETLDDFEQEVFAALQTYRYTPGSLTAEQDVLLKDFIDITVEDELVKFTQKDTLTDSEQELFEALQAYENPSQPTSASEIIQKTETGTEPTETPDTSSARAKVVHNPSDAGISSYFRPKNSEQAKVVYNPKDHVKAPDSAIDCYNRGLRKYKLGQYKAAISDYDTAIQLKLRDAFIYYDRGLAKYKLGQCEAAIADYDTFIRLKPNHALKALAYWMRGLAKYKLGQCEAAIADYDTFIRLKPDYTREPQYARVYCLRGLAKYKLGQYEAAIADYDTVIRFEPEYARTYYNRGNAKTKLSQAREAEQDWQTALKLATQAGNVELKNEIESALQPSVDSQIELNFEPDQEKVTDHSENQVKTSEPQVKEMVVHYSEDQVKDIVAHYFESLPTASPGYSVKREYLIQMGSDQRRADIVFLRNGKLVAIAECKRTRRIEKGNEQLHSYLCATDTFLGIFANNSDPNKWTFWENHRHNNFLEIDRETFENYVYNHDKAIKDREKKIKLEIEREIDAEIRQRVRKNTDTDAVRQNETDRIKREITENIDKTAIVNSVKSQIAQQAENRLLNKRDEENRKRGREQGFWWTIFSLIGIGILIALLITSAA